MTRRPPQTASSRWELRPLPDDHEALREKIAGRFQVHPVVAQLLLQRNLVEESAIERFLCGTLADLPNPFGLADMDRAVDRLIEAFVRKEKILFFGDYDVDGITGCAQLQSYFRELGLATRTFLPHRLREGYGLTEESVRRIAAEKPNLVVTIDNGTRSVGEIGHLRGKGIDVIVIDHHETPSEDERPGVIALVNPKSSEATWAERDIASAGLVFLFLMAFRSRCRDRNLTPLPNLKRYLDLACLGTVADVVPLTGTNRLLVRHGLEELANTSRPGLKALCEKASVQAPISTTAVSFRIAPRLNAAGRLEDPTAALDLLLARTTEEAAPLVQKLEELNRQRQRIEEETTFEAIKMVDGEAPPPCGITVAKAGWHLGVVGIVASKLVERFGRPAVVLAISEDGREARGSARTVPGFSIYAALKRIEGEMRRFGGHAAAAGMTVDTANLSRFRERFDASVRDLWDDKYSPALIVDAEISLADIPSSFVRQLSKLEPYGPGNPEPVFVASPVRLEGARVVGSGKSGAGHLKTILSQDGTRIDAIGFNRGGYLQKAASIDFHRLAFSPQFNYWNGNETIQARILDILSTT